MLAIVAILAFGITIGQSTAQVFTDKAGNTYEVIIDQGPTQQRPGNVQQQYYPQQHRPYYPQQQQQTYYPQRFPNRYTPQTNSNLGPGVSVANAEWVCTNSRTKDIMIIAGDVNPGTKINVPGSNQPNNQPGNQPTFGKPPTGPLTFPNVGQNVIPTTQRPSGPFWPDFQTTTTAKPVWPAGNGGNDKPGGLIVVEPEPLPTTRPIATRPTTTQAPSNNGNNDDDDDDGPIKIDFGK